MSNEYDPLGLDKESKVYDELGTLRLNASKSYKDGDYESALNNFKNISYITDLNDKAQALYNCGTCCIKLGRHSEALPYFEQSLFIRRESKAFFNAAYTCVILFKMDLAKDYVEQALKLSPNDTESVKLKYRIDKALNADKE